jgi:SAM-dependent methyltransferase
LSGVADDPRRVSMASLISRLRRRIGARARSSSSSQQATFTAIFKSNAWGDAESVSGPGSSQSRGADFQRELLSLLDDWRIRSIVDAPCGDFNWMRNVLARRDVSYTGIDIVDELISANNRAHACANRRFLCADMTRADLPEADLVICRDGLVHLSFADARAAIRNFRRSGGKYLLVTTFVARSRNMDVPTGGWRVLNMQAAPFRFPAPLALIDERCAHSGGIYRDKRLALWNLASLNA